MKSSLDDTVTEVAQDVEAGGDAGSACLLVISGSAIGRLFKLSKPEMIVGRGDDADILIDDVAISRHHAKLRTTSEDAIVVEDLGSKNGTFFDGHRV